MIERRDYWFQEEKFEREQRELETLVVESGEAWDKIENGIDTSATQLDRYLTAHLSVVHWEAQHAEPREPWEQAEEREEMGIEYLKTQKILSGSYHKEKAAFCAEIAQYYMQKAEKSEQVLAAGERSGYEDRTRQSITRSRRRAANWLRTEANCLEMPEGKPVTPPPPQPDH